MCVDRSSDIFTPFIYIPGGIYEFAHGGGTPIAYLGYPYDGENGCSVDPTTGDLAVVGGPSFYPALVIYRYKAPHRWGFARSYALPSMSSSAFCGYDSHGDLFVDGKNSSGAFVLAELSKGSKTFAPISVSQDIKAAGQVQWDGKHLAIGDAGVSPSVIYQFDVTGSIATKSGSTKFGRLDNGGAVLDSTRKRYCSRPQKSVWRKPSRLHRYLPLSGRRRCSKSHRIARCLRSHG